MQVAIEKIKKGEYRYMTTDQHLLTIKKSFYDGLWNVWHCGVQAPAFAMGFATKKEAVEFLTENLSND